MALERGATRDVLLESALELFSRRWYETVSVAEICRTGGLSNGIFYRYFRNKEAVFRELLDSFIDRLEADLDSISGKDISNQLGEFLLTISNIGKNFQRLLTVFKEGQYRFPEYETRLRIMYIRTLSRIYGREISLPEYLYITSGVRFLTNRTVQTGIQVQVEQIKEIVEQGVFTLPLRYRDEIFTLSVDDNPADSAASRDSDGTRNSLLNAGIRLFGERGFYNVNVYEIAKEAGFSVGTFYIHFPGKEAFLSEIVDLIGRYTRRFITSHLDSRFNRLENELRGMFLFVQYFSSRRHYYEIVREAEFVVKDTVRRYYDRFTDGYGKNLSDTREYDMYTLSNALIGISHYLGIEILFTQFDLDAERVILEIGRYLQSGLKR